MQAQILCDGEKNEKVKKICARDDENWDLFEWKRRRGNQAMREKELMSST